MAQYNTLRETLHAQQEILNNGQTLPQDIPQETPQETKPMAEYNTLGEILTFHAERNAANNLRLRLYTTALNHWINVGYSYSIARALAAVLHGQDDDVKRWAKNIMETQTNLRLEDMI